MKSFLSALACSAALLTAAPAFAGPALTITSVSVRGDDITINGPGPSGNTTAGPITVTTTLGTFATWCIDLYHEIYLGGGQSLAYQLGAPTTDSAPTPTTLTTAQKTKIGQLAEYGQSLIGTAAATNDNLAAVQLAIWTVENPGFSYSGASGASVSGAMAAAASEPALDVALIALSGTQTLVTADPVALAAVPEPAGIALIGSALGLLGLARRRRA